MPSGRPGRLRWGLLPPSLGLRGGPGSASRPRGPQGLPAPGPAPGCRPRSRCHQRCRCRALSSPAGPSQPRRRGECRRLARNPTPFLEPPWLVTPLDTLERDTLSGWLLPCLNSDPELDPHPHLQVAHAGLGARSRLCSLSGLGDLERSGRPGDDTGG